MFPENSHETRDIRWAPRMRSLTIEPEAHAAVLGLGKGVGHPHVETKWLAGVTRQEGADHFLNVYRPPLPRMSQSMCVKKLNPSTMPQENCHHLHPLLGMSEE